MLNTTGIRLLYTLCFAAVMSTFWGHHYLIDMPHGQVTYLLEAPISAYSLTSDLQSQYGPLYHLLNALAAKIVAAFPEQLHPFDMAMIRALTIAAALMLCSIILNRREPRVAPCLTLLAISCALQPHSLLYLQDIQHITWHNMANNQMLGLLICILPSLWTAQRPIHPAWYMGVLYSCLHFMPSFFPAVGLILLTVIYATERHPLRTLTLIGVGIVLLTLITAIVQPSTLPALSINNLTASMLSSACGTVLLYGASQLLYHHHTLLPFPLFATPLSALPAQMMLHRIAIAERLYHHGKRARYGAISLALITLVCTDTLSALSAVILLLAIEICSTKSATTIRSITTGLIVIIIIYHALLITRISTYKWFQATPQSENQLMTLQRQDGSADSLVIHKHNGYRYFQELFQLTNNPAAQNFYQRLSYDYDKKHARWRIPFTNVEYIEMLNQATTYFQQWPLSADTQIVLLGPSNPLPLLLHTPMPQHSYLSLSNTQPLDTQLTPLYQQADFIYLPLFALPDKSQTIEQTDMNCHFYDWNEKKQRFHLVQITPYGCIFATQSRITQYHLPLITAHAPSLIHNRCNKRHA